MKLPKRREREREREREKPEVKLRRFIPRPTAVVRVCVAWQLARWERKRKKK
jgi:hypothetical protein